VTFLKPRIECYLAAGKLQRQASFAVDLVVMRKRAQPVQGCLPQALAP
jgi:hypothetical protein